MSGYLAFLKKEFTENIKNYRFFILLAVFLVFGVISAPLAKYTVAAAFMTVSYWLGYAAAYGCTALLWDDKDLSNAALAACSLWIVGFLYLSILMIGCVIFRQTFTGILFTGGIVALISMLGMTEPTARFNPFILTSKNVDLISGQAAPAEFVIPAFLSVALSAFGLLTAVRLFRKKQL